MITLKIPEGNTCGDCMFLDYDVFERQPECALFQAPVIAHCEYGQLCRDKTGKCERCLASTAGT